MRANVGDSDLLSRAELRLFIRKPNIEKEQRLELYQGLGPDARYIGSRFVYSSSAERWLSFDVTQTLKDWLQGSGEWVVPTPGSSTRLTPAIGPNRTVVV